MGGEEAGIVSAIFLGANLFFKRILNRRGKKLMALEGDGGNVGGRLNRKCSLGSVQPKILE